MSKRDVLSGIDPGLTPEDTGLEGIFKSRYDLKGREWLKDIPEEERQEFGRIGANHQTPQMKRRGGQAREAQGQRDHRGRFVSRDQEYQTGPGEDYNPDFSDADELLF